MLDTQDKQIPEEIIDKFTNPSPIDIAVIKTKEKGERVSLKRVVKKVSTDINHH